MVKWDAKDYACNSTAQLGWARELIAKLDLSGSESVLDIGCGDGKVTAEIAKAVPGGEVLGVDKSEEMVRFARESFSSENWPNLSFAYGDASDLRFRDEFDVVFSNATLHWVIDHMPVLRGIGRALKPGGRVLLQMGGRSNASRIQSVLDEVRSSERWAGYSGGFEQAYGFYGPEEYAEWLPQAGLKATRVELIPKDMTQNGREGLAGWMRTTWLPYTERVPKDLREEFVAQAVDRYISRFPLDGDGIAHVRMVRLEVEAVRNGSRSSANGLWMLG